MSPSDESNDPEKLRVRIEELEAELAEEREQDDRVPPHPLVTFFKVGLVITGLCVAAAVVQSVVEWVRSAFS